MEDWGNYKIKNIKIFSKKILSMSCKYIEMDLEEAKSYIKISNVVQIVKEKSKKGLIINEEIADDIVEEIQSWLVGCQLAKMCAEDILECYWSDEGCCMVFSVKEEGEKDGKKHNKNQET